MNRISIVVSFLEKIAIFNALTLENHYTITTCYANPGFNLNPVALGPRYSVGTSKTTLSNLSLISSLEQKLLYLAIQVVSLF